MAKSTSKASSGSAKSTRSPAKSKAKASKTKTSSKHYALVIVESPAKAKTIAKYLGSSYYRVSASMGHVRDLPAKKIGIDIENDFTPTYRTLPTRRELIQKLTKLAKDAERVYLATDMDREGEAIAWHLAQAMKVPKSKVVRVVFNEITKRAITQAFESGKQIDQDMVNAQQARRLLDRIVGYELSPSVGHHLCHRIHIRLGNDLQQRHPHTVQIHPPYSRQNHERSYPRLPPDEPG